MSYQDQVEWLLEQIRERVDELRLLKTYGVRAAALAERKRELARARQQLQVLVN